MSQILYEQAEHLGFSQSDIAKRSEGADVSSICRVLNGKTCNPGIRVVRSIITALSLTPADRGVLSRRYTDEVSTPPRYQILDGVDTFAAASTYAKDALNRGSFKAAADGVVAMLELATNDLQRADAYEQAAGLLKGMGKYEEAKVNYEAADRLLPPTLEARKRKVMGNLTNLQVWMDNVEMGRWLAEALLSRLMSAKTESRDAQDSTRLPGTRASTVELAYETGWAYLTIGDASMHRGMYEDAATQYTRALGAFNVAADGSPAECSKADCNLQWARIHVWWARATMGDAAAQHELRSVGRAWEQKDAEISKTAQAYLAHSTRNKTMLRQIEKDARRHRFGEVALKASKFIGMLVVLLAVRTPPETSKQESMPVLVDQSGSSVPAPQVGRPATQKHNT